MTDEKTEGTEHFCWKCGFSSHKDERTIDPKKVTAERLGELQFLTLPNYRNIKISTEYPAHVTLYIINDRELEVINNEELLDMVKHAKHWSLKIEKNEDGDVLPPIIDKEKEMEPIDCIRLCPKCETTVLVSMSHIESKPEKMLYLLFMHGIKEDAVHKLIERFDIKLTPKNALYSSEMENPLHAIANGNNKNELYGWLHQSGMLNDEDQQNILLCASIVDHKDEQKQLINKELIRSIVKNGAEWKDLNIPYKGLENIMKAFQDDKNIYNEMVKYYFVRSIRTGQGNI